VGFWWAVQQKKLRSIFVHLGQQVGGLSIREPKACTILKFYLIVFVEGQSCVDLVRAELGPELADIYVPLTKGGVQLHKLQGVMHDTCNTANKTARLAKTLRATSGRLYYGYEEWEERAAEDKPWFDYLCGNHTRNLPMDAFNKEFA
jgi:hypothetical protein